MRTGRIAACAIAVLLMKAAPVRAQIVIRAGDDVNFRLGVLGQFQADTIDTPGTDSNTSNLFARRLRLMFGGQVAKNVTFFVETDAPNLGKTLPGGKNIQPSMIVQDAYAELKVADAFALDAGLMFVPFSRNSIQSAATLLPVDYSAYTFSQSAPTQSSTGRDTGFQAKGYFLANHLEYRVGAFQGIRDARSHSQSGTSAGFNTTSSIPRPVFSIRARRWAPRKSWRSAAPSTRRSSITRTMSTYSPNTRSVRARSRVSSITTGSTAMSRCRRSGSRTTCSSSSDICCAR
jgi:hypothetical protein